MSIRSRGWRHRGALLAVAVLCAAALGALTGGPGRALADPGLQTVTVSYPNFGDLSSMQLNGTTAVIGNPVSYGGQPVLRLTNGLSQSGSAFLTNAITLANNASFSTYFSFQISHPVGEYDSDGIQGADGLVFVVQTVSNTAGGNGGGIGYAGLPKSVGVEFDTWNNGASDGNDGNHVGIDLNGNVDSAVLQHIGTPMNNGAVWYAWVDYNGSTSQLEVRLSQTNTRPTNPTLSYTVNLASVLQQTNAFVGFTSGTGAAGNDHDIRSWTFINRFQPIASGTLTLANVGGNSAPDGSSHTVTASVTDNGVAAAGAAVHFSVTSGPNAGASGDATTDSAGHASFAYTSNGTPGVDTIAASFTDTNGFSHTDSVDMTWVNQPPTANPGGPYSVNEGGSVTLTGTGVDPEGGTVTYAWDLDNNGTYETPGASVVFDASSIPAPATRTVGFQACDSFGACTTATTTVTINNVPPTANAGGPYSVNEGGAVVLHGSGTDVTPADGLTYAWDLDNNGTFETAGASPTFSAATLDGPSTHTVALQVCDDGGACTVDTTTVTVTNTTPTANAGAAQTVYRNDVVHLSGTWTDPAQSVDSYTWSWDLTGNGTADASGSAAYGTSVDQAVSFANEGTYTLTFTVSDENGATGSSTVTITVLDHPPSCTAAAPSVSTLWPANHEMVPVTIQGLTDAEHDPLTVTINSVFQDEPVISTGSGHTAPDATGIGTDTVQLRAERDGTGNGRVYHVGFSVDDGHGGSCSGTVTVSVPHDQRGAAAVDDGPLYDSTGS